MLTLGHLSTVTFMSTNVWVTVYLFTPHYSIHCNVWGAGIKKTTTTKLYTFMFTHDSATDVREHKGVKLCRCCFFIPAPHTLHPLYVTVTALW